MRRADKLFEKLGYKILICNETWLSYTKDRYIVDFDLAKREFSANEWINFELLDAINMKVEELGWE